jgi:hypothetical protein
LINGFSEQEARQLNSEQSALSLLIVGRCNRFRKDVVQASIDFSSAWQGATSPLLKARVLCDLVDLDIHMNRREAVLEWSVKSAALKGGSRTRGWVLTIDSMLAAQGGNADKALALAQEAVQHGGEHGRPARWLGHLLCVAGRREEVEGLLQKMISESAEAQDLMAELVATPRRPAKPA